MTSQGSTFATPFSATERHRNSARHNAESCFTSVQTTVVVNAERSAVASGYGETIAVLRSVSAYNSPTSVTQGVAPAIRRSAPIPKSGCAETKVPEVQEIKQSVFGVFAAVDGGNGEHIRTATINSCYIDAVHDTAHLNTESVESKTTLHLSWTGQKYTTDSTQKSDLPCIKWALSHMLHTTEPCSR